MLCDFSLAGHVGLDIVFASLCLVELFCDDERCGVARLVLEIAVPLVAVTLLSLFDFLVLGFGVDQGFVGFRPMVGAPA